MEKREVEGNALKNIVQYGFKSVLCLLVPRKCIVCEKTMEISEKHLCHECLEDLPCTYYWLRKFNPMADRFNVLIQKELESHIDYAFAAALFFYRSESGYSQISRQLKYHGNIPAGQFFGRKLGRAIASAEHFANVDAVIPVPLHWTRKWSRGYNQAEIIAREVAAELGAELRTDILKRSRRTRTQTKLSVEGKATNVQGAFSVRPGFVKARTAGNLQKNKPTPSDLKHLLLIDDVFTSGSTLHACFTALRSVFPPSVRISVATLAFVGDA
jgi:ComF family protein